MPSTSVGSPWWPRGPGGPRRPGGPTTLAAAEAQAPPALPIVAAIGVTGLDESSVTLVGSINTQGLPGAWWFVWGAQSPHPENQGPSAAASATTFPQTVELSLSGLTTGATYYFALVGQTAGGTVTSPLLSFTPEPPAVPSVVTNSVSNALSTGLRQPHFRWPFKIVHGTAHVAAGVGVISHDGASMAEQDSTDDIDSCVEAVLACTTGQFPESRGFGIPDLPFSQTPVSADQIRLAVVAWEPRASIEVETWPADVSGGLWNVQIRSV